MSKYRIFALAKEFNTEGKVIIDLLKKKNFKVQNNFSSVGDEEYEIVKAAFAPKKSGEGTAKTAVKEKEKKQRSLAVADGRKPEEIARITKKKEQKEKEQEQQRSAAATAEVKAETAPKSEPKTEPKPESKTEAKTEALKKPKTEAKTETKTETKSEAKKETKSDAKAEAAAKAGPEPEKASSASEGVRSDRSGEKHTQRSSSVRKTPPPQETRSGSKERKGRDGGSSGKDGKETRDGREGREGKEGGNNGKDRRKSRDEKRDNRNARNAEAASSPRRERGGKRKNRAPQPPPKVEIARPKHIKIGETIAVKDLASKMSYTAAEIIKKLLLMGVMASINQEIDYDTAALVAAEFGVTAEELPPEVDPTEIPEIEDDPKSLKLRPPVVTVMGHVDHGKTSLLDVIRKTSVSAHEAGGITQHIGAYQVMCKDKKIVFLDTPGHEAFTAMRARGAQVTDIAILVVAADDGVMPQTVEAINHAKSANVPIIVAINKIDKPGANPEKVKQELMEHGLVPEEYGGDNIMVPVSAKKQMGINDLLENILLVAEVQELKANPNREARGVVIEAQLDKGRGPVATVLVQNGTLRVGDSLVAGTTYGKVRAMANDRGDNVKKAGPSVPVEVLGLSGVPAAGDIFAVLDEKQAKSIAEHRIEKERVQLIHSKKVSLNDFFEQLKEGEIKDLNILVKADVQGSVEALNSSLLALNKNDEVRVSIVHSGVGAVNESDVMLASASNALIIAFNVRPDANARRVADSEDIEILTYRVIYDALNDVKSAMSGMLAPKYKEVIQGRVEIRKVMKFSKALVAGSYVLEGKIMNNSKIRILRDNVEVFDGAIDSLRRFKDDVKEVAAGYECGISIVDYRDFREGDIIEAYTMEEVETSIAEANKAAAERRAEEAEASGSADQDKKE